jgi:ribose transport system ATP-binding protein
MNPGPPQQARESLDLIIKTKSDGPEVRLTLKSGTITGLLSSHSLDASSVLRALVGIGRQQWPSVSIFRRGLILRFKTPRQALRQAVLYVSPERETEGVFTNLSASDNVTITSLSSFSRLGLLDRTSQIASAQRHSEPLGFDCNRLHEKAGILSGGNQQKLLLARLTVPDASLYLLDEPNRGLDPEAQPALLALLRDLVRDKWLLIASSDVHFLARACDEILPIEMPCGGGGGC